MRWIDVTDPTTDLCARSVDGYYRVTTHYGGAEFVAWFLEAVFAKPVEIGTRGTLDDAKEFCEEHALKPRNLTTRE